MALGKRIAEFTGLNITDLIHSVVEAVADRSAYSLGDSQHAPKTGGSDTQLRCQTFHNQNTYFSSSSPTSFSTPPFAHSSDHNKAHPTPTEKSVNMTPPLADVDDSAGFLTAARSYKPDRDYGKPPVASKNAPSEDDAPQTPLETADDVEAPTNSAYDQSIATPKGNTNEPMIDFEVDGTAASTLPITLDARAHSSESEKSQQEAEESREHLTTFASWGTPVIRDKPAALVRRIIMKGLPSSWATPDKVLSLVHGGNIESVSITPSGNAHVLFCDPVVCKAFYDKYPNGIDLDKERKLTVFVDLGEDVDVISSQLAFNLSVGSTRVVRAIGVERGATMTEIVKIATASNRKVEKIIDIYIPGYPRSVSFRFCSIDDAVRFRAALVRNEDWEHCNVQYATDPCEVATGCHAD